MAWLCCWLFPSFWKLQDSSCYSEAIPQRSGFLARFSFVLWTLCLMHFFAQMGKYYLKYMCIVIDRFKCTIKYFNNIVNGVISYDFFRHSHCYFTIFSPSSIFIPLPVFLYIFHFSSLLLGYSSLYCFSHSQPYSFSLCWYLQLLQVMLWNLKIWS